ncbi:CBS domain-containing protein [Planctomycetota bacterium]
MPDNDHFMNIEINKKKEISINNYTSSPRIWMKVDQMMSKDVSTISPNETVASAAIMMTEKNISCIVVVDNGDICGILTETDLLKKKVIEAEDNPKIKVKDVMSSPAETASSYLSVLEAGRIMEAKNIKRLPILNEQKLVGIVTQTDVTRILTSYGMWRDISEIMSRDVSSIERNSNITQATQLMSLQKISSIIVMENDEVLGILTEKDLLNRVVALNKNPYNTKIEEVMTSPIISVSPNYSIFSASRKMETMHVRRLVVIKDKKLCGIVTQTDIFRAVKNKLQTEEEKNLRYLEESKNGIFTTNLDHVITYVNPAFVKLFKISDPQEFINQVFLPRQFWINPEEKTQFLKKLKEGTFNNKKLSLKTSKGKKIYVNIFSTFATGIHGEINGYHGMVYDLTAKEELIALRKAEKERSELINRIVRINRELKDFAHVVSHDLKEPLRAIKTLTQWISDDYEDKLDEKGNEQLELLVKKVEHMHNLVEGILKYSRAGHLNNQIERINLNDLMPQIISMITVPDHIKIIIDDKLPVVKFERTQITQVFQNLLNNAVKYMDKPQGQIRISCIEEPNIWKFGISDNGPGIEEENYDKIFQIFQALKPQDEFESTGIGLAIIKKIVESYGGTIWIESEVGFGSTFFFTIAKQDMSTDNIKLEANVIS